MWPKHEPCRVAPVKETEDSMDPKLRPAAPDDAAPAGAICYTAFKTIAEQHAFPPDFPNPDVAIDLFKHMLSRTDIYGVVAERDGRVVGSNFLWKDGPVAGVGPITVDPAVQNGRVGRKLMESVSSMHASRTFPSYGWYRRLTTPVLCRCIPSWASSPANR